MAAALSPVGVRVALRYGGSVAFKAEATLGGAIDLGHDTRQVERMRKAGEEAKPRLLGAGLPVGVDVSNVELVRGRGGFIECSRHRLMRRSVWRRQ